jgi:hypothetical protein
MLDVARTFCDDVLPNTLARRKKFEPTRGAIVTLAMTSENSPSQDPALISPRVDTNGDAELWQQLCTFQNPLPMRVVTATWDELAGPSVLKFEIASTDAVFGSSSGDTTPPTHDLWRRDGYGTGPVGDHLGRIRSGVDSQNLAPWCLRTPSDPSVKTALESYWHDQWADGSPPPYCPVAFLSDEAGHLTDVEASDWSRRGAMNAGLSVFLYLDSVEHGTKPIPDYDHCEQLETN